MINWLEGKSDDIKRKVVKDITEVIHNDVGVDQSNVTIIINDLKKNNFAKGGLLAQDQ
jgi:4-oxalocrotonate tautomerase